MNTDHLKKVVNRNPLARAALYPALAARRAFLTRKRSIQQEIVDHARELLQEDPVFRLESFKGDFAVDPRSHNFSRLLMDGVYEPELLEIVTPYVDETKDAIDVGANVGFYSVWLAKTLKGGRVLAVEPTKNALEKLHRNLEMNEVGDRVEVFEGVVSDEPGTTQVNTIPGKEEYTSLGEINHPSVKGIETQTQEVKSETLESLVESRRLQPGFLKVDVEGAEHLVFRGSLPVLERHRPVILSELSDELLRKNGSSSAEVIQLIRNCDYEVINPNDPAADPAKQAFGDILCFPKEKAFGLPA